MLGITKTFYRYVWILSLISCFYTFSQCSIPVFDGLLPEPHNKHLLSLLFTLAHWHALAKLRQHTDSTLEILTSSTNQLGLGLRAFKSKTCSNFETQELQREIAARGRRQSKGKAASIKMNSGGVSAETQGKKTSTRLKGKGAKTVVQGHIARRRKSLNLKTYKNHSLDDYAMIIRRYGTTDSYSTEPVSATICVFHCDELMNVGFKSELDHRSPKSRYFRTSRKQFERQLAQIERREARIRRIRQKIEKAGQQTLKADLQPSSETSSLERYYIGKTQNNPMNLGLFLRENQRDPVIQVKFTLSHLLLSHGLRQGFDFAKGLNMHLRPRIQSRLEEQRKRCDLSQATDFDHSGEAVLKGILIKDNRLYLHKLARFYHTTYDVRRSEDIINPRTSHCDVMLLSSGDDKPHPFVYARVLAIYHVNVIYNGPGMLNYDSMRFDFMWVRWFQLTGPSGANSLDCLSFPPIGDEGSFGFIDPELVLRGCHLIPAFSQGKRYSDNIGLSKLARDSDDWQQYYVNRYVLSNLSDMTSLFICRFADRDMMMRYHWGLGVGHTYAKGVPDLQGATEKIAASTSDVLDDEGQEIEDGLAENDDDIEEDNVRDDDELSYYNGSENGPYSSDDSESEDDDEEFLELYDTYHS